MINSNILDILAATLRECISTMQSIIIVDLFGYQLDLLTFSICFSLFMGIISTIRGSQDE